MSQIAQANPQATGSARSRGQTALAGLLQSRRNRLLAAIALALLGLFLTLDAWQDILYIAIHDSEASQVWLVPVAAGWLVINRKHLLPGIELRSTFLGPALIALGGFINWYGFYHFNQAAWHGGALLVVVGAFLTLLGWRVAWRLLPVFILLLFLIPVPGMLRQRIAIPLQEYTAVAVVFIYDLMGFRIEQAGNQIVFNGQPILIAEACNGMRMIFALLLVTYTVAFASPLKPWVRVLILGLSPLLAVLCNIIRVTPTVYMYGQDQALGDYVHNFSGWIMVGVAFLLVMGLLWLLRWLDIPIEDKPEVAQPPAPRDAAAEKQGVWPALPSVLALALLAVVGASGMARPEAADAEPYHQRVKAVVHEVPRQIGDWIGVDEPMERSAVELLKPNATISRQYTNLATGEKASVVVIHTRDARDMLGHYPPVCYPNAGWTMEQSQPQEWHVGDHVIQGTEYHIQQGWVRRTIANILLLPDGTYARDMEEVNTAAADFSRRFFGAGQVQVLTSDTLTPQRRQEIIEELLTGHLPLIEAIGSGVDPREAQE